MLKWLRICEWIQWVECDCNDDKKREENKYWIEKKIKENEVTFFDAVVILKWIQMCSYLFLDHCNTTVVKSHEFAYFSDPSIYRVNFMR